MKKPITFIVDGNPAPKQSFRYSQRGSYQTFRVHTWQNAVGYAAKEAMQGNEPLMGPVAVRMVFTLGNRHRQDCDNLSKGVLDGMRGIVYGDDSQIVNLHIVKHVRDNPGVFIQVFGGENLPPFVELSEGK